MKNSIFHFAASLTAALALTIGSAPSAFAGGGDINWEEQFNLAGGTDELTDIDLREQKILVVGGVGPSTPGGVNDTWIVRAYDSKDNGSIEWEDSFVNPDGRSRSAVSPPAAIACSSRDRAKPRAATTA